MEKRVKQQDNNKVEEKVILDFSENTKSPIDTSVILWLFMIITSVFRRLIDKSNILRTNLR